MRGRILKWMNDLTCLFVYYHQQIMPIREGKAKLWFNTKEQQDEFDDKMIASVQLQSMNFDDESFSPVFYRKRQEYFLELSDKVKNEAEKYQIKNIPQYLDKYFTGKRDHSYWREWTIHRFSLGFVVSYLLIRELPIRNFYARSWIMAAFVAKVLQTSNWWIGGGVSVVDDQWSHKAIKNYGVYQDSIFRTIPTLDGKLPEESLWKLNQPGYLKATPHKIVSTAAQYPWTPPKKRVVAWDGTWNMPLENLADPAHKDAKNIDFIYI